MLKLTHISPVPPRDEAGEFTFRVNLVPPDGDELAVPVRAEDLDSYGGLVGAVLRITGQLWHCPALDQHPARWRAKLADWLAAPGKDPLEAAAAMFGRPPQGVARPVEEIDDE